MKNMKTKKIKIAKATCLESGKNGFYFKESSPWYENKIGDIFDVLLETKDYAGTECYNVVKDGYTSGLYIKVTDCEDVK